MKKSILILAILMVFSTAHAESDWKFQVLCFVQKTDATPENQAALAGILANNGSLETVENELKMFLQPAKFSLNGELPAQVYGFAIPAKTAIRDELKTFLDTLDASTRYAVIANTDLAAGYDDRELIMENFTTISPSGQTVTWAGVLTVLFNELGLRYIPPADTGL